MLLDDHPSLRAPLKIIYALTAAVTIEIDVTGDARNFVTVTILYGSVTAWAGSMSQAAPTATIEYPITMGTLSIQQGATFTLTVPTPMQNGNVQMNAMLAVQGGPWTPFAAQIASWPLSS